jgi:hypothetical protein
MRSHRARNPKSSSQGQHPMRTRFHVLEAENRTVVEMAGSASRSKFELVNLKVTTPEPRHDEGSLIISSPPIIDLVTPEPVLVC